jgi:hypothetical protein
MDGKINTEHSLYMNNFYNIYILTLQMLHTKALEHNALIIKEPTQ